MENMDHQPAAAIWHAEQHVNTFDYEKALDCFIKQQEKDYIYKAGVYWPVFDFDKGIDALIDLADPDYIFRAGRSWKTFDDAKALEDAGVFSMILEAVPAPLGEIVAQAVNIPVIGIGAGNKVDGQVLVTHDMIGLFDKFVPKFVKQYTKIRPIIIDAMKAYKKEVIEEVFPAEEHSFNMPEKTLEELKESLK